MIRLSDLEVGARAARLLAAERLTTAETIAGNTAAQLLNIKGFGHGCLAQVIRALDRHGLQLAPPPVHVQAAGAHPQTPPLMAIIDILNRAVATLERVEARLGTIERLLLDDRVGGPAPNDVPRETPLSKIVRS